MRPRPTVEGGAQRFGNSKAAFQAVPRAHPQSSCGRRTDWRPTESGGDRARETAPHVHFQVSWRLPPTRRLVRRPCARRPDDRRRRVDSTSRANRDALSRWLYPYWSALLPSPASSLHSALILFSSDLGGANDSGPLLHLDFELS